MKIILQYVVSVWLVCVAVCVNADAMLVKYWSSSSGRASFELEIMREAFARTEKDYPPYRIDIIDESMGSLRGRQEVVRGERLNIYAAPFRNDEPVQQGKLLTVSQPLTKGILGYRHLIVRRADAERYTGITEAALKQKVIGQGAHWPDVAIYRHNDYRVDDTGRITLLLDMLAHGRVDLVAFGINEAAWAIADAGLDAELMILPDTLLYYPLPVVFQVSGKAPQLAQRLEAGLAALAVDGYLDQLIDKYYGETIATLLHNRPRIFVLKHPEPDAIMGLASPQWVLPDAPGESNESSILDVQP